MVLLTRHEESIKARLCFAFSHQSNLLIYTSIFFNSFFTQAILPHCFLSLFELLLLPFAKSFPKFSSFPNLENLWYSSFSFSSPFAKKNSPRTNRLDSFCVSLLPFPKEQRTNRLNSLVSPFSLVKEFKTTQSENSFDSSLFLNQNISKD